MGPDKLLLAIMDKIRISSLQGQANYQDWKIQVENVLKYYGLHKVVNGVWKEDNPPAVSTSDHDLKKYEEEHEKWVKVDCHAMALLTSNMEKKVRDQLRNVSLPEIFGLNYRRCMSRSLINVLIHSFVSCLIIRKMHQTVL